LLVPIFGLAAIAGACVLEAAEEHRPGLLAGLLAFLVAGVLYNVAVTTAFPELPHHIQSPLSHITLPIFDIGHPSPNLGMSVFGLEGMWSLLPLILALAGLVGYLMWPLVQNGRVRLKGVVAFVITLFVFGLFVHEYPEDKPKRAAKFAKSASKRNVQSE
jgi:Na+-driven multidrug efflux pump